MDVKSSIKKILSSAFFEYRLPSEAKAEREEDRCGLQEADPGIDNAIKHGVAWLEDAQDNSDSQDGGIARDYSLITGWNASYPETTGYVIPTLLNIAEVTNQQILYERVRRMLDWLVSIQMPCGAFEGGTVDDESSIPVAFNTGQIIIGLAAGARIFQKEEYSIVLRRASDWLVAIQDQDGAWRKYESPDALPGGKTYHARIAYGLLEAARVEADQRYINAALSNVKWVLSHQHKNGWFESCDFSDPSHPLTHTIGYTLRGIIEAYKVTKNNIFLVASQKTADKLLTVIDEDGFLPGRLDSDWDSTVMWSCLTGTAQIAICWLILYTITGDIRYRDAAFVANRFVRRTMKLDGVPGLQGGVKGAFPIDGEYNSYCYVNWACKFLIDSNVLEKTIRSEDTYAD